MRRALAAFAVALVVHAVVLALLLRVDAREVVKPPVRIALAFTAPSHVEKKPAPVIRPRPRVVVPPPPAPPPVPPPAAEQPVAAAPAPAPAPSTASAPDAPRAPAKDAVRDVVRGTAGGPQPSLGTLEAASDLKTPGPESDTQRAARVITENLEEDISAHDVARGLADDWFRRRRAEVERAWHPSKKDLVDGGKEVSAPALLARTALDPLLWNAASHDVAGDGSRVADDMSGDVAHQIERSPAAPPETDRERRERIWGDAGTHRDAFKTRVGLEVAVHHRADGSVQSVEVEVRSGHGDFDKRAVDALAQAFALDADDKIPVRVARGRPFVTRWALDASWEVLVPKCSYLESGNRATSTMLGHGKLDVGCGTSFGNDGVDVPFTVKKQTHVELIAIQRL